MATTGTHRTSTVLIALIVGAGLGWLATIYKAEPAPAKKGMPTPTPTCVPRLSSTNPQNYNVFVGATANDVHPPCLTISENDTVTWRPLADGIPLRIEFDQQVFANMNQVKSKWRVNSSSGSSSTLYSGKVLAPGDYYYTQGLGDEVSDGHIIIVKP
jgi:hypothetical protein